MTYQEYNGKLHFGMDVWTSPNHKAIVAFLVYLANNGRLLSMVLDIVEVARVSSIGINSHLTLISKWLVSHRRKSCRGILGCPGGIWD